MTCRGWGEGGVQSPQRMRPLIQWVMVPKILAVRSWRGVGGRVNTGCQGRGFVGESVVNGFRS